MKTNTVEINFLAGKSDLVINQAIPPPIIKEIRHATKAIPTELTKGL